MTDSETTDLLVREAPLAIQALFPSDTPRTAPLRRQNLKRDPALRWSDRDQSRLNNWEASEIMFWTEVNWGL